VWRIDGIRKEIKRTMWKKMRVEKNVVAKRMSLRREGWRDAAARRNVGS
jgi:hypothetical protein